MPPPAVALAQALAVPRLLAIPRIPQTNDLQAESCTCGAGMSVSMLRYPAPDVRLLTTPCCTDGWRVIRVAEHQVYMVSPLLDEERHHRLGYILQDASNAPWIVLTWHAQATSMAEAMSTGSEKG